MKVQITYNYLTVTLNLLGGLTVRGRLQRTSGKWGGGVVLKFRTFPDGGRGGGL